MSWYKLIFEQIQPIHIGKLNWGVVSETEIFITGQTMWGALVNAYAIKKGIKKQSDLEEIRKKFETITNFFPSFDGENILEPAYEKGEFVYEYNGDFITEEEFRLYFVDADFKTSIDPFTITAKEEQLYEFEYILPKPKEEFTKEIERLGFEDKLYWVGLIKLDDENIENFIKEKPEIFIGGDTRYGYGLMKLKEFMEFDKKNLKNWNLNEDGNFVYSNSSTTLRNFLEFDDNIDLEGEIKLIPEMNFFQNTPFVEDAKFYITIGSKIKNNISDTLKLNKGKFKNANSS